MEAAAEAIMEPTQEVTVEPAQEVTVEATVVEATLPAPTVSQPILQPPPATMGHLVEVMVPLTVEVMEVTVEPVLEVMEAQPRVTTPTMANRVATDMVSLQEVRDRGSTTTTIEKQSFIYLETMLL